MGDFTKLAVWKKAHELTLHIYRETSQWPRHELFGLTSQSRRAAVSVPANLAEGCGKNSDAELARHARDSLGSASELSYYLILAHDLSYTSTDIRDELQGLAVRDQENARVAGARLSRGCRGGRTRHKAPSQSFAPLFAQFS